MRSTRSSPVPETMADLLEQLGGISPCRVRLQPLPGKATEKDLLDILKRTDRLFELVDGVLVEKVMGFAEAYLANWISYLLQLYLDQQDLGILTGADGAMRLMPKLVRIPDVSFVRWEKFPNRTITREPIPDLVPDLAIEVLSESNTPGEMKRKLKEYFLTGVQLVWLVDLDDHTVKVFSAPDKSQVYAQQDTLDGGDLLPGLALPVKQIFVRLPAPAGKSNSGKSRRLKSRKKNSRGKE